ncbi:signal-transducing adaptor protein 1-like [Mastacembelus armatus]|uniref:Signal-transducing adaptor protein 1-like n=1 Tax=Mastacembelus armatus TaxID=205130 RepID=A0A7N8YCB1_9TELE|nr:signal-transducing adaptor protein 1-like [Mastacembelus armatus]
MQMATRPRRQRGQLPDCYYEGYLERTSFTDQTPQKLWTCLCGNTLFFFTDKKDANYIEKLDLNASISVTDSTPDHNLHAARFNLHTANRIITFTAPSAEACELWKNFIHAVSKLCLPSSLTLLPGQVHILKLAVEMEKERLSKMTPPSVTKPSSDIKLQVNMPACYYIVSRMEAELLLQKEAKRGNLLLRPGRHKNTFAVTTRQELDSPIFRHYLVTCKPEGGFYIDVDNPVDCDTLHDVISFLVEKSDGTFIPLPNEGAYEKSICIIRLDHENGEKQPPSNPPQLPSKPELRSEPSKMALMPPVPPPRRLGSSAPTPSSTSSNEDLQMKNHTNPLQQTILELKEKFEQKQQKSQE